MQGDVTAFQDGAGADGEVLFAAATSVITVLPGGDRLALLADRTDDAARPAASFEVALGRFLVRKWGGGNDGRA